MNLRNWISHSKKTVINEGAITFQPREGKTVVWDLRKIGFKADTRNKYEDGTGQFCPDGTRQTVNFVQVAIQGKSDDIMLNLSEDQVRFLADKFDEALKYHF